MKIDRSTLVFFDASSLVAAAGSPEGGSGFLLSLCRQGFLRAAISQPVLLEAERNVLNKFGAVRLSIYHALLASTSMLVVPVPSKAESHRYREVVLTATP